MEAIVLAGGLGTRLKEAVADVPKPMAPVNQQPFLQYLMDYWVAQGVTRFILSVGFKWKVIKKHFGSHYRGAALEYSVEDTPMGTGGGVLLALSKLIEAKSFLLLNGDTFFKVPLESFLEFHNKNVAEISLSLSPVTDAKRYDWVHLNDQHSIERIEPRSNESKSGLINGGVYLINPKIFAPEDWDSSSKISLENDMIPQALQANKNLKGYVCSEKFIDIGIPEDYRSATTFFEN